MTRFLRRLLRLPARAVIAAAFGGPILVFIAACAAVIFAVSWIWGKP